MIQIVIFIFSIIIVGCSQQLPHEPKPMKTIPPSPKIIPKRDIKSANEYRQLGLDYRKQGNLVKAIQSLEKSVILDPQNISGKVILGWTYHLAKQEQKATQVLLNVLQVEPNNILALNALGIVYLVEGNLEKAVETHTKAAQLKPDNEIAHYNLSLAYHRLQEYEQAIAHAQKATTLEPNNPHPWVALAMIAWSQNKQLEAQKTYNKAISLDSRYQERVYLEHLQEAGFSAEQIEIVHKIQKGE
jgi:Tfp pilus assembly protein PilF